MKKLKHILSYACDKRCSYCINELLTHHERQNKQREAITEAYMLQSCFYDHIMLSGGEPVLNKMFPFCIREASDLFRKVSVITAHKSALSNSDIHVYADDVIFSIHKEYLDDFHDLRVRLGGTPVYASMVYDTYLELQRRVADPLYILQDKGFKGATIRQTYPNGAVIDEEMVRRDTPEGFSVRMYTKDNCEGEDDILLPNLTVQRQADFVRSLEVLV
jgi:hypothetical protein